MTTKSHFSKYVIFLIIVITFPTLSFAAAGKVAFVLGQVDKKDENGVIFSVNKQTIFESSDIIITKKNGQLMLIMADKSKITIRPNTTFHIKDYSYRGDTKTDKSHYNLVKGGFRYVTGKMGKTNKSSFKLKTAIGTIGIRGTDFEANLCDQNCDNDKGLFVNVVSGGVSLNNSGGSINVEPGKIGHIESSTLTPTPTNKLPDIMTIGDSTKTNTKHATSEEQIVSIALRNTQTSKNSTIGELVIAGLSNEVILGGSDRVGIEAALVVEALIQNGVDSSTVIRVSIERFPEQTTNILTMGIATRAIDTQQANKLGKESGVNAEKMKSVVTTGKLLRPPTVKDPTNTELKKPQTQKTEGSSDPSPKKTVPKRVDPQLIPKDGNEGGPVPSPS